MFQCWQFTCSDLQIICPLNHCTEKGFQYKFIFSKTIYMKVTCDEWVIYCNIRWYTFNSAASFVKSTVTITFCFHIYRLVFIHLQVQINLDKNGEEDKVPFKTLQFLHSYPHLFDTIQLLILGTTPYSKIRCDVLCFRGYVSR